MTIHKTVLLEETVDSLNLKAGMTVVDATLGGGGHSKLVLEKIGKNGKLIAFDQDLDAIKRFEKMINASSKKEISEKKSITLFHDNFLRLKDRLALQKIFSVDAIVADLGISSDQLADQQRGMSFLGDYPLDMRMNQKEGKTAEDIVNTYTESELTLVLQKYGDEKFARKIVKAIISKRGKKKIVSTRELIECISEAVPERYKHQKINFATRTFQALRIEVNQELTVLEPFLAQAIEVLKSKGRLAVITFHSGEDAIVKNVFRENARGCICPPEFPVCRCDNKAKIKISTRKPILPSAKEVAKNPRARSAKLRVVEKI